MNKIELLKCNIDHPTKKGKNNSRSRKANEVNSCQFLYRIDENYTCSVLLSAFTIVCKYCNVKLFRDESTSS